MIPANQSTGHAVLDRVFAKHSNVIATLGPLVRVKHLLHKQRNGISLPPAEHAELTTLAHTLAQRSTGDTELDVMLGAYGTANTSDRRAKMMSRLTRGASMLNLLLDGDASDSSSEEIQNNQKSPPATRMTDAQKKALEEADAKAREALLRADTLAAEKKAAADEANAPVTEEQRVEARNILKSMQPRLGLAIEQSQVADGSGIKVLGVVAGSSAALAGILIGDHIRLLNGMPMATHHSFIAEQKRFKPGDDMHMTIIRDMGKRSQSEIDIIVRMGAASFSLEQVCL